MSDHQTEEQQVEAIKAFWSENGNSIIAGLVLGFAGFIGFGYYKDTKLQQELNTSESYQNLVELAGTDQEAYIAAGEKFIEENAESSYSPLTALSLAKEAASHKDWAKAEGYLSTAVAQSKDAGVKAIATIRLARVQIELAAYEKAIKTLSATLPESFLVAAEEIKGDAYLKLENVDLARTAYQKAIDSSEQVDPSLQMKLDDLAQHIVLAN